MPVVLLFDEEEFRLDAVVVFGEGSLEFVTELLEFAVVGVIVKLT